MKLPDFEATDSPHPGQYHGACLSKACPRPNRHGRTDERVEWIGTLERLNELLEAADVLLISAPLTRATHGLIGAVGLQRMKADAVLVNVARGEIVQERPLYDHLVKNPRFMACIDARWVEPVRHGEFRMDQPFLNLPNVIASPHNSAQGTGAHDINLRRAVENCRRALTGETPLHLIGPDERLIRYGVNGGMGRLGGV